MSEPVLGVELTNCLTGVPGTLTATARLEWKADHGDPGELVRFISVDIAISPLQDRTRRGAAMALDLRTSPGKPGDEVNMPTLIIGFFNIGDMF